MANEKQSVVNFLTPTKLITGSVRQNKPKLSSNQSQYTNLPVYPKRGFNDVQSRNYSSQFQRNNYRGQSSLQDIKNLEQQKNQIKQKNTPLSKNFILENTSKTVLKSQNNFKTAHQKIETRSVQSPPKPAFQLYKVQQTKDFKQDYIKQKVGPSNSRLKGSYGRDEYLTEGKQSRGWYKQTQGLSTLIEQMKGIKQVIDVSLAELQNFLDNTSKFLNDIDLEYLHFKQWVLDYTAQVLDAGFARYKLNMVNWAKYEEVQKRAKEMSEQLHKSILEEEVVLQSSRISKTSRITLQKQDELREKLQGYQKFSIEIQKAKLQGVSMRPQIRKDKIVSFEQALNAIADF